MYGPALYKLNLGRCKILSVLVRISKILIVPLLTLSVMATHVRAQSQSCPLRSSERYLESLRQQAGIPGLSAGIMRNGQLVWDSGFWLSGRGSWCATGDTIPSAGSYAGAFVDGVTATVPRAQISRSVGPCAPLEFAVQRRQYDRRTDLAHAGAAGTFRYSTARYAALTTVIDQCSSARYSRLITEEILNRLG